ncbi:MAG: ThiF family adenylyltransferase [Candidatus Obscuribacterales bacterium]|nr:ThiF family adenylyltransferase [Candidatus Obscuribacterales bacterium]
MIDTTRHISIIDPDAFGNRRIDVIGAGATGSKVVLSLAKLGLQKIRVFDFDEVARHNIGNQAFGNDDIGKKKVDALSELVYRQTGLKLDARCEKVDGSQELGPIVFLLTDTMASRKEIWERALRFKSRVKLMIETRLGADSMYIYTINPCSLPEVNGWESTLCDDAKVERSACGKVSLGPSAGILAEKAVWQLIRWFAIENGQEDLLDHEIMECFRPPAIYTRRFED